MGLKFEIAMNSLALLIQSPTSSQEKESRLPPNSSIFRFSDSVLYGDGMIYTVISTSSARRSLNSVAKTVHSPSPFGKGNPVPASRVELLPEDWSPMMIICGIEMN